MENRCPMCKEVITFENDIWECSCDLYDYSPTLEKAIAVRKEYKWKMAMLRQEMQRKQKDDPS